MSVRRGRELFNFVLPPREPPAACPLLPLFKIKIRFRTLAVQAKILFGEITYKKKMRELKTIYIGHSSSITTTKVYYTSMVELM